MSEIARLYCTHCTFGTSALETASADNAAKVLGYSVRASSLPDVDRGRLRQVFRSIERLLSYDLPRDASAADKEKLDAASAPRRLIFLPSLGDSQVVGQVCYRTHDTAGRPGSYFADMIVARLDPRQPEQAWSPVECLELWAADYDGADRGGWWCDSEDSLAGRERDGSATPFAPVAAVREIRALAEPNRLPLVSVDVLRAFLFETGDRIDTLDAGRVIPPRWRDISAETRREFFARLLQATIDILQQPRDTLVLAVEPSLAALLFYGVCRLLPPKLTMSSKNSSGISFSTYEPFPERPMTRLVATTFLHGDASADLPADVYQRGFACNTFRDDCNTWQSTTGRGRIPQPGAFVNKIVDRLGIGGATGTEAGQEVNGLLQAINSLENISARSLDGLIRIDDFVTEYATGSCPLADLKDGPRIQPKTDEEVFRRQRFQRLIEQGELERRTEWPSDLLPAAIDWLGDSLSGLWRENGDVVRLLRRWLPTSPEGLKHLARSKPPEEVIRDAVVSVTRAQRRLPDCLPEILDDFSRPSRGDKSAAMLQEILSGLEDPQNILLASNPTLLGDTILAALEAIITSGNPPPPDFVESLLVRILDDEKRSQDDKWSVLRKSAKLAASVPHPVRKLGRTLDELFDRLVMSPPSALAGRERGAAVEALQKWASLTEKWERNNALLLRWKALFDSLTALIDEANKHAGKKLWSGGTTGPSDTLKKALQSIDKLNAEPSHEWTPQRDKRRRDRMMQVLQLARPDDDVRQRVEGWVEEELRKEQKLATAGTSRGFKREMILGGVIAASVIAIVATGVLAFYSDAARDRFSFARRTAAGKQGGPESTGRTPDVEQNSAAPEESQKTAGQSKPTGANALAHQTNTPGRQPPQAKPLTPDDLGLKAAFEAGELVISWQRDLGAATTLLTLERRDEYLDDFETKYEFRTIISDATVSRKSEFRYPSQSSGKDSVELGKPYRVTLTAKRGSEPEVTAKVSAALAKPSAPDVGGIDLDLDTPNQPFIKVALTKLANLKEYGEVEYCLKCNDKVLGQAAVPNDEAVIKIPISKKEWRPEDLREAMCTLCVVVKSTREEGKASTNTILNADIGGFMKQHLESRSLHNVNRIWALEPESLLPADSPCRRPMRLHPFMPKEGLDLKLRSPQFTDGIRLRLGTGKLDLASGITSWQVLQSSPSSEDPSSTTDCGSFYIDWSKDPWSPLLEFLPADHREDPQPNQLKLSRWRLATSRLIVDNNGEEHDVQLMSPIVGPVLKFALLSPTDTRQKRTVAQRLKIASSLNCLSETSCEFRCDPPDPSEDSGVRIAETAQGREMRLTILHNDRAVAYTALSFVQDDTKGQNLLLSPVKWSPDKGSPVARVPELRPKAEGVIEKDVFGEVVPLQLFRKLLYAGGDSKPVDRIVDNLRVKGKGYRLSEYLSELQKLLTIFDESQKNSKPENGPRDYTRDDLLRCIKRANSLVERDVELEAFVRGISGIDFRIPAWSVQARVEGDATTRMSDENRLPAVVTIMVGHRLSHAGRFE